MVLKAKFTVITKFYWVQAKFKLDQIDKFQYDTILKTDLKLQIKGKIQDSVK